MPRPEPSKEIERFLRTGQHDMLGAAWPGKTVTETAITATAALREALVTAVLSRTRHAVLPIAFGKRETFAYACEALSRIHELGPSADARRSLLSAVEGGPLPPDKSVDADEFIDILREAVSARNGWKRILQRCAPPKHRATTTGTPT